jgi:hypothetical protein
MQLFENVQRTGKSGQPLPPFQNFASKNDGVISMPRTIRAALELLIATPQEAGYALL